MLLFKLTLEKKASSSGIFFKLEQNNNIIPVKYITKPIAKNKLKSAFVLDEEDFDEIKIAVEELVAEAKNAFADSESDSELVPAETAVYEG